ncbi:MAG TPA: hypothetical protein VIV12_12480 [Streptosporangiaceae bacterium]
MTPLPPVTPRRPVCWLCKGRGHTVVAVTSDHTVRAVSTECPYLAARPVLHPGAA